MKDVITDSVSDRISIHDGRPNYRHLGLNDLLILYTDGITEVKNEAGAEFGRERLFQLAHDLTVESPSLAGHTLLDAVQAFRGGTPWPDDRSLMVFKRIKECAC